MSHEIIGPGSIDRRPDTFSWSYLTTFTFGPVQLGDFSEGILNRVWRFRCDGNAVYGARQATQTTYDPEFLVLEFEGVPVVEIDAAFNQQGRVFICAERPTGVGGAPEVWVYFFNPTVPGFVFVSVGPGRTPRAVLDDAVDTNSGDILLFYMNDNSNAMCYRQQRDRYAIEYIVQEANGGVEAPEVYGPITVPGNYDGITVEAQGLQSPPVPHTFPPTRGDFQSTSDVDGKIVLFFSEPIKFFSATIHYPNANGNTMYAVKDASQFSGSAGEIFAAESEVTFAAAEGDTKTLESVEGFQYVVFKPLLAGQEVTQLSRAVTFSNVVFQIVRDTTINAPITVQSQGRFIEDVYKAIDSRVHILFSERNIPLGTYKLMHIESVLYPQRLESDSMQPLQTIPVEGGSELVTLLLAVFPEDASTVSAETNPIALLDTTSRLQPFHTLPLALGSELHETLFQLTLEIDSLQPFHSLPIAAGSSLRSLTITTGPVGPDGFLDLHSLQPFHTIPAVLGHSLIAVVIPISTEIDNLQPLHTVPLAAGSSLV
jgi:hypothetical protein